MSAYYSRKPKPQGNDRKEFYQKKKPFDKNKPYFLPKKLKENIDAIFDSGCQPKNFMQKLNEIVDKKSNVWDNSIVYIIHEGACRDRLEIIELILRTVKNREEIANSKCGPKEFTPIFKSAYKGSIRALKMLLCAGADVNVVNSKGETVMQALEQGNIDFNTRNPQFKIFTDSRFDECRTFLKNWDPNRHSNLIKAKDPYIPPSRKSNSKEKANLIPDNDFSEISINEFLANYKDYNNLCTFLSNEKNNIVNLLIESSEIGEDTFSKLINNINFIDKKYIQELASSEDLKDYVKYDAPYTKTKINELFNNFSISLI